MKLVDLAREAVRIIKEHGEDGIRSDILAEHLDTPKRRVYDVVAVLKALDHVDTTRKFDGTTVTWMDRSKDFVPKTAYDELRLMFGDESDERKKLQVQVAELKEQVRIAQRKLSRDVRTIESADKTEFNTTQLRVRALSSNGIKNVEHSGVEVLIRTHEAGIVVDPEEKEEDPQDKLLKAIRDLT